MAYYTSFPWLNVLLLQVRNSIKLQVLILLLFHDLSLTVQKSYNVTRKTEGVQGLRRARLTQLAVSIKAENIYIGNN